MRNIVLIVILMITTCITYAQDNTAKKPEKRLEGPLNTISGGVGRAFDISHSTSHSNLGFDYLRRFNPKWEWGIQLDLDWEKNFVKFEGVSLAGIVAYSLTPNWPIFCGLGMVNEEEQADVFVRFGTEYTFFLGKDKRIFLAPGTFVDTNLDGVTLSGMIVLGWVW